MTTGRKYLVDISGQLPTIVCEIDTADGSLKKSYIYADAQVLAQREHDDTDPAVYDESFYVHDRLGSVRLVVDDRGTVANSYTYTPFGSHYDGEAPAETVENPFKFTGQWLDAEINQYYLRARQYDPTMMRFTSRDPVRGKFTEPATLHKYMYCANSPTYYIDLNGGTFSIPDALIGAFYGAEIGAAGGALAGVVHETFNLMINGEFEIETVGKFMAFGALTGAAGGGFSAGFKGIEMVSYLIPKNFGFNMVRSLFVGTVGGAGKGLWNFRKDLRARSMGRAVGTLMIMAEFDLL